MKTITVVGLDIAKSVFQVHGIDAEGKVAIQLKRARVLPFFTGETAVKRGGLISAGREEGLKNRLRCRYRRPA